ncbi:MAG: hypothetical protein ACAI25_18980 [Planctomycetota bacterium]
MRHIAAVSLLLSCAGCASEFRSNDYRDGKRDYLYACDLAKAEPSHLVLDSYLPDSEGRYPRSESAESRGGAYQGFTCNQAGLTPEAAAVRDLYNQPDATPPERDIVAEALEAIDAGKRKAR